MFELEWM